MPRRKTRSVRNQYYIRAPPKKVFKAITSPERLTRWFADHAEVSPRKGGRYVFEWKDGPRHTGKILQFVRGKSVTYAWTWDDVADAGVTRFKLAVAPRGKGTLLSVAHSGIPRQANLEDLYIGAVWGWTYFMMNLKSVIENGHDLRSKYDG